VLAAQYNHLHIVHHFVDTLNALMKKGGRASYQEVEGVDALNPSFWEARLMPIRRLREIPKPTRPCYISRDPKRVKDFGVWRRRVRHSIKNVIYQNADDKMSPRRSLFKDQNKRYSSKAEVPPEEVEVDREKSEPTVKSSKFTYASYCRWMKSILRGKAVTGFMLLMLFVALYLPDFWVIAHVKTSTALDVIMITVMASFALECILICSCDSVYRLSFFFWMDFIGTVSCIFDLSFFPSGHDADEPMAGSSSDAQSDLVTRYARTGKIAARAGRITRLVRLLKFLPGVKMDDHIPKGKGATSAQLGREISKRVALLTILLVGLLPLFDIGTFPVDDQGLQSWLDVLHRQTNAYLDAKADRAFVTDAFKSFGRFFEKQTYGPFDVCIGQEIKDGTGSTFRCDPNLRDIYSTWNLTREGDPLPVTDLYQEPAEKASLLIMTSSAAEEDNPRHRLVQIWFDFTFATTLDATGSVLLMTFTIFIMCGITLTLSSSVNTIAVTPIQRILDGIRTSAKRIFSSVNALQDPGARDGDADEDNEILLLEEVVKKIARLSDLISQKNPWGDLSKLESEERGILALADVNTTDGSAGHVGSLEEKLDDDRMLESRDAVARLALEEMRMSWEKLDSWEFSILEFNTEEQTRVASWFLFNHQGLRGLGRIGSSEAIVNGFIDNVMKQYLWNSYHNWSHAVDVMHTVSRILNLSGLEIALVEPWEQYALLVSAICHDIAHPGTNNPFLIETNHDLALRYNDKSPLENMHCSKLFETSSKPEFNIFQNFSRHEYKEIRKVCIATILHTDIIHHFALVKECSLAYQLKKDVIAACSFNPETLQTVGIASVFENVDRMLLMKLILHLADISNPAKPWKICHAWAMKIIDEFFAQGAQEAALGLPVQILNDKEKVNKAHSQVGFMEFIVVPCLCNAVQMLPFLCELGTHASSNLKNWQKLWLQEGEKKDDEEVKKVDERVTKTCEHIKAAMDVWKIPKTVAPKRMETRKTLTFAQ